MILRMAEDMHDEIVKSETGDSDDNNQLCGSSPENGDKFSSQLNCNNESEEEGLEYDGELPLEVITTVSKDQGPVLKVKSNGVLTHRNIFTDTERAVLKDIVVDFQEIVDTRSRARETFIEKQQAWQKIVLAYNSRPGMQQRTVKELRKCWDNMKYRARQAEKDAQQKSLLQHEQSHFHLLSYGDVSITKDGLSFVNGSSDVESPVLNCLTPDPEQSATIQTITDDLVIHGANEPLDIHEPALRKAQQDAPKLSSLLMAANWSNSNSNANHLDTSTHDGANSDHTTSDTVISIDAGFNNHQQSAGTKMTVSAIKEDAEYGTISSSTPCSTKVKNINLNYANGLPKNGHVLPAGSTAAGASGQLQRPVTTFHLGSGMTITSHSVTPPNLDHVGNQATNNNNNISMRPMPALKKMGMKRQNELLNPSRKNKNKKKFASSFISSSMDYDEYPPSSSDVPSSPYERELYAKLINNRMEQEQQEHRVKMKVLEKQLQAFANQSSYWAVKLKLLKAGKDSSGSSSSSSSDDVHILNGNAGLT